MSVQTLFLLPNLIGYIRLILLWSAFYYEKDCDLFVLMYSMSLALDGVDGYVARRLQQTSRFGAWLDVVIDLISRGCLWVSLGLYGYGVMCLEWLVFVSLQQLGADWKLAAADAPWLVRRVMSDNFKNPLGFVAVAGLFLLPFYLYLAAFHLTVPVRGSLGLLEQLQRFLLLLFGANYHTPLVIILCSARGLAIMCELWYLSQYVLYLLNEKHKNL